MDIEKVSKAITYLRKRSNLTQKDLADRLGISDKAVSKWERGLSLPDVSLLGKLSIILDTDTDSLLSGDVVDHKQGWCGLLYLNKSTSNIPLNTIIFDKPLVYFLLGYFILLGIKDIYVVSNEIDKKYIEEEFSNGNNLGISIKAYDKNERKVLQSIRKKYTNSMVVLDKTFIYGVDQTRFFQRPMVTPDRVTVLSLPKRNSKNSRIHFNGDKKVVELENTEQIATQYDYYELPVFYTPCEYVESIVKDENYKDEFLYTEVLDRGFVEIPIYDYNDVNNASTFVRIVEETCGMKIYCLEEMAWRRGLITYDEMRNLANNIKDKETKDYILSL